jgi:hypothetical protein
MNFMNFQPLRPVLAAPVYGLWRMARRWRRCSLRRGALGATLVGLRKG